MDLFKAILKENRQEVMGKNRHYRVKRIRTRMKCGVPKSSLNIDKSTSLHLEFSVGSPQGFWQFIGKYLHLQHIIYGSPSASASLGLWQQPVQIALLGEARAHSGSKDRSVRRQKTLTRLFLFCHRLPTASLVLKRRQESEIATDRMIDGNKTMRGKWTVGSAEFS